MKIYSLLSLALILTAGAKSNACGASFALPSGCTNPNSAAFSPDSSYLAVAGNGGLVVFKIDNGVLTGGALYLLPSGQDANSVAFSPDGAYLATAGAGGGVPTSLVVFGVDNGELTGATSYTLPPNSGANSVAFSPDGANLATTSFFTNNITLFSVSSGVLGEGTVYSIPSGSYGPVYGAFSPDSSYFVTANLGKDGTPSDVTVFNVNGGGATSYSLPSDGELVSVAFSPNGSYLAAASASGAVTIANVSESVLSNGTLYYINDLGCDTNAIAFSPNGSHLAFSNSCGNDVAQFNVSANGTLTNPVLYPLPSGSTGSGSVTFSLNGLYLATSNGSSNNVTLFPVFCLTIPPTGGVGTAIGTTTAGGITTTVSTTTTTGSTSTTTGTGSGAVLDGEHAIALVLGMLGLHALIG